MKSHFSSLKHEFLIVTIMTLSVKFVLSCFSVYCYFIFLVKEVSLKTEAEYLYNTANNWDVND